MFETTMMKKERLAKVGVKMPGFPNMHEVKKPLLAAAKAGKKNIYLIISGIFSRTDGATQDVRGDILDFKRPPAIRSEAMASYWAEFVLSKLPTDRKFSSFEECKSKCANLSREVDVSEMKILEDLIIILDGKMFNSLSWITVGRRSFVPLEEEEIETCRKLEATNFAELFSSSYILANYVGTS